MDSYAFNAIGTHWTISLDGRPFDQKTKNDIQGFLEVFSSRFSRFLPESEVHVREGTHTLSDEFTEILTRADALRKLTNGSYDPAVAGVLERAGYNKDYRLTPIDALMQEELPIWTLEGDRLSVDRDATFDLGGIGKGYAIDRVAKIMEQNGCEWYLVEGGGDMVATRKKDGYGWRVAIEWPGKDDTAAAVVTLKDQGLAASDTFRRRWGKWHHIVDAKTQAPVGRVLGCTAIAKNGWDADSMTSALFFAPHEDYQHIAQKFDAQYLVFLGNNEVLTSRGFPGEKFF